LDESLHDRKNKLERWGVVALSTFGLGVFGLVVSGVVYKLLLTQGSVVALLALLGLIVFLGSGVLSVVLFAKAKEVAEISKKHQLPQNTGSTKTPTTRNLELEAGQDQVPSVTEWTTEILSADKVERRER
jgi:hypothetical protein